MWHVIISATFITSLEEPLGKPFVSLIILSTILPPTRLQQRPKRNYLPHFHHFTLLYGSIPVITDCQPSKNTNNLQLALPKKTLDYIILADQFNCKLNLEIMQASERSNSVSLRPLLFCPFDFPHSPRRDLKRKLLPFYTRKNYKLIF